MVNIIVADDDINVRNILSEMLKKKIEEVGNIHLAKNGKEVITILKSEKIDIVISDIKMPIMDGITMCREVREFNDVVKIILISAYVEFEYAQEAMRYAVSDYIIKPINRKEFEKLKQMILELAQNKEKTLSFYLSLYNEDLRQKVKSALHNNDSDYLFGLLDQLSDQSEGDVFLVKEYALLIGDAIYDYVGEMGFSHMQDARRNTIATIVACTTSESCILTVVDLLSNITQFNLKPCALHETIKRIKNIIDTTKSEKQYSFLNVNELAERHGLPRTRLSAAFKKEYGVSINKYILDKKMEYGLYLVRHTDYSSTKIATILGYSDLTGFNRMFRKYTSKTPTEYKELYNCEE